MMTNTDLINNSSPTIEGQSPSQITSPPAVVYENQMKLNKLSSLQTYGGAGMISGGTEMPKDSSSDRLRNAGKEVIGTF